MLCSRSPGQLKICPGGTNNLLPLCRCHCAEARFPGGRPVQSFAECLIEFVFQAVFELLAHLIGWIVHRIASAPRMLLGLAVWGILGFLTVGGTSLLLFIAKLEPW